ncbi:NADP-dependent malic enzyme-like [Mizuhopecten yessoensis]|uniref:Malic enzyme n=1 Tax=Mizuhopecten yessoensis TaxID=6573 RepID=A0A210QUP5_MIZYE|nr:NADP-dependent malic enzyme-like [Mizuhopecten yessoensis]OWF52459.1 NADP-dependent malic enzyme [Mizuhopecten yessoensis]
MSVMASRTVIKLQRTRNLASILNSQVRSSTAFHTSSKTCTQDEDKPRKKLINHSRLRGIDILRTPKLNKGQAFTLEERQLMGIQGLLPSCVINQDQQMTRVMANFHNRKSDVDRYVYLMALKDRNERLFYRCLTEHTEEMMPIVYTPTVGQACQEYGVLYRKPRGLFISIHDKGHIYDMMCNWHEEDVKAIVVTDGERILGLGDLGVYGMGIPVGKLALYTALGGITPDQTLPIVLDVGTNNETLQKDPLYIGHNHPRVTGQAYDDFIDEFMEAVVARYGQNTLIQFEDFANHNAFRFLEKYRNKYCVFNDDIQGTAAVAAAGVFASLKCTGKKLGENVFCFQGAGEASIGIASLLVLAMEQEGMSSEEAISKIWMVDSRGLLVKDRPAGGLTEHKLLFAKDQAPIDTLADVVKASKPSILIGAAAVPGAFTESIIKDMAMFNEKPVIFALSNPTSMSECTAEQAYKFTDGRCVFASGSPFLPVTLNGKTFHPGQGNNAYIFPGIALGAIVCGIRHISEDVFLKAAQTLGKLVTEEHLAEGRLYPPLSDIQDVSLKIATGIAEMVYKSGNASTYPEPENKEEFIRNHLYDADYESFVPETWTWPDNVN